MQCPVCRNNCDIENNVCSICGYENVVRDPLQNEDFEQTIKIKKMIWFMSEEHEDFSYFNPSASCNNIERTLKQLNVYFNYDEQLDYIKHHPDDYHARSWFIDCLREIYVLGGTFPITSRKYVKKIIEEHMFFFEFEANYIGKKREYITTEHLIHRAEMALADCDFSNAYKYYLKYLYEIKRLKAEDDLSLIEDAARCILHNCYTICKFLSVERNLCDALQRKLFKYYDYEYYYTEEGMEHLQKVQKQEKNSLYIHSLGCGLSGAYYTDKDDSWIFKPHQATIEDCVFNYNNTEHYSAIDMSTTIDCQLVPIKCINGLMYQIEYVTDVFSISDTIYNYKEEIEEMTKKLILITDLFD